ncbi:MAG TPA: serine hydrolase [Terriglobia bacterium]|nr:serine hydrolase [Terriglobia bacterium]
MMFYETTAESRSLGEKLVSWSLDRFGKEGLAAERFALTLLPFDRPLTAQTPPARPAGFSYHGDQPFYPCSVVKAFYLAAVEARLEEGAVQPHDELDRAMRDMILWSSNTATNYIIDLVTGTTGDTLLGEAEMRDWVERRQWVNRYLQSLGWPELKPINVCQKLMDDDRYGREKIFVRLGGNNHNCLTSDAAARLFYAIFSGQLVSPARSRHMAELLHRSLAADFVNRPAAQVLGYFGAGLPAGAKLWSKAGWTGWTGDVDASYRRHDAAYVELPSGRSFILTAFTQGKEMSESTSVLPGIAAQLCTLLSA